MPFEVSNPNERGKPLRGKFTPKNPKKYLGNNITKITFRSRPELIFMQRCDEHPNIIGWMSECIPSNHVHSGLSGIPYAHPFRKTNNNLQSWTFYVPDFFVIYLDEKGKQHAEIVEYKPYDELPPQISGMQGKVSKLKESRRIINAAKWEAALIYCAKYSFGFRIMTEKDLYNFTPSRKR